MKLRKRNTRKFLSKDKESIAAISTTISGRSLALTISDNSNSVSFYGYMGSTDLDDRADYFLTTLRIIRDECDAMIVAVEGKDAKKD